MPQDDGHDYIIVSDLHLSAGYDPRTGTYNRNEDFFFDAAFARFTDNLLLRARQEDRRWRLLMLGDVFDFLQVEADRGGKRDPDTSDGATIAKLERIAAGHPEFFEALGRFAMAGHLVDIVPGNHDIELIRPAVQERLKELLAERCGDPEVGQRVSFYPWIYYVPGVMYAEHGHQYDRENCFPLPLRPYVPGTEKFDLPLGSYFVTHLFNRIESIDPFADNVKPPTRYLLWSFRVHPILALFMMRYYFSFFFTILVRAGGGTRTERAARQQRYRETVLPPHAAEIGLSAQALAAIDGLSATPTMWSRLRLLRTLIAEPLLPAVPLVGGLVALYAWLRRVEFTVRSLTTFAIGVLGLAWRERRLLRPATQPSGYLHRAALTIHRLLRAERHAVPCYIFGHTHTAEQYPLALDPEGPRYLNSGTWTPIVPTDFELLGSRERFTFVQVTRDPTTHSPIARLLQWNDAAGRTDPLPILTSQPLETLAANMYDRAAVAADTVRRRTSY